MITDHTSPEFGERVWPSLEEAARERLEIYWTDLLRYNRAQNLISRRDPEAQLGALIEECVAASVFLGERGLSGLRWADIGSGGGIPGLVLGALNLDQALVLIERRQGRCDFLRREVRALGLTEVQVEELDAVDYSGGPFGLVLAKAVAPPGEIETLCSDLVRTDGILALFGRPDDDCAPGWSEVWRENLPGDRSVLRALART
jgi:16S rRNA (guanine527-N7)-methyltransferase